MSKRPNTVHDRLTRPMSSSSRAPRSTASPPGFHLVAVPLVEQTIAAVKMAEALVALAPIKATRGSFRRPPATPSIGLPQKPRGSHRPHGFVIGDHALPASWAACGCKFVHVLAALFTVVVAPSSIPLDVERPEQVFVSGTIDASRYPAHGRPWRLPRLACRSLSR
jgi:hypothetical protein